MPFAVAIGLALAACGSGDGGESASGEDEIASLDDGSATTDAGDSEGTGETDSGDTDTGETDSGEPVDPEDAMLEFAECMREHGIDMPDPQIVTEGGERGGAMVVEGEGIDGDADEFREADEACSPIMEDARGSMEIDPEQEAEMREEMLEFAQCMRDQGIDYPDPQFDGDGRVTVEMRGAPGEDFDPEAMEDAAAACSPDGRGPAFVIGGGPAQAGD